MNTWDFTKVCVYPLMCALHPSLSSQAGSLWTSTTGGTGRTKKMMARRSSTTTWTWVLLLYLLQNYYIYHINTIFNTIPIYYNTYSIFTTIPIPYVILCYTSSSQQFYIYHLTKIVNRPTNILTTDVSFLPNAVRNWKWCMCVCVCICPFTDDSRNWWQ